MQQQAGYGYAPAQTYVGGYTNGNSSNDNSMTAVNYVPQGYPQTQTPNAASGKASGAASAGKQRRQQPNVPAPQQPQQPQEQPGLSPYEVYGPHITQPAFGITGYTPQQASEMTGNVAPNFAPQYYYPPTSGGGRGGRGHGRHNNQQSANMYFGGLVPAPNAYQQGPPAPYYYSMSYTFSGNNAVPEKTATIYVRHPETSKVMGVKLNRILDTLAPIAEQVEAQNVGKNQHGPGEAKETESGADAKSEPAPVPQPLPALTNTRLRLCPNFMSAQGCTYGSCCTDVHAAGMEYLWDTIVPKTVTRKDAKTGAQVTTYAPGFLVRCFDPTLTHYYEIPSESVLVNRGSDEYIRMFNFNGNNFKKKFKVFTRNSTETPSEGIADSTEIYCTLDSLESEADKLANTTHVNDMERMKGAERLPESMMVRVYDQNNYERYQDYPGSLVLITEGAKSYAKMYAQCHNSIPVRKRMQHCAHFRLHNMCRLGSQCRFVHVLRTAEEIAAAKAKEQEKKDAAENQSTEKTATRGEAH